MIKDILYPPQLEKKGFPQEVVEAASKAMEQTGALKVFYVLSTKLLVREGTEYTYFRIPRANVDDYVEIPVGAYVVATCKFLDKPYVDIIHNNGHTYIPYL